MNDLSDIVLIYILLQNFHQIACITKYFLYLENDYLIVTVHITTLCFLNNSRIIYFFYITKTPQTF